MLLTNLIIEVNRVDRDQTAPIRAVRSGFTLIVLEAYKTFQQTTKVDDFCCDWRFKG